MLLWDLLEKVYVKPSRLNWLSATTLGTKTKRFWKCYKYISQDTSHRFDSHSVVRRTLLWYLVLQFSTCYLEYDVFTFLCSELKKNSWKLVSNCLEGCQSVINQFARNILSYSYLAKVITEKGYWRVCVRAWIFWFCSSEVVVISKRQRVLVGKSYKLSPVKPRILGKSLFCHQEPLISRLQTKKMFVIRCCEPSAEPIKSRWRGQGFFF